MTSDSEHIKEALRVAVMRTLIPKARLAIILVTLLSGAHAMAANGLTTISSSYGPAQTIQRFEAEVRSRGMTVFAQIDHSEGAAAAGLSLRPTKLLIFGSAKAGTPLMMLNQTIGIDLPLKVLVWQDEAGGTWLSYNDPDWIAKRHELGQGPEKTTAVMTALLSTMAKAATK